MFVAASNYFAVLQPRIVRQALDLVIESIDLYKLMNGFEVQEVFRNSIIQSLLLFGGLVILFAIIMGVFMYFMRQTIIVMSRLIEYDLRKALFKHYELLDQGFFRRHNTGDLMARISEDVSKVRMYLGPAIMYGMNLITLFILVVSSMLTVNKELSLYTLLPLPFLSISIYYISNIINVRSEQIQKQLAKLNSIAQEIYSGIRVVKSYVQEKFLIQYFGDESEDFKNKSLRMVKVDAMFFPILILFIGISNVITIYVGGIKVTQGLITAGNVAEFVIYINMLTWPFTAIGWIASIMQQASASQKRINEFLETKAEIQSTHADPLSFKGDIKFDNVTFVYPDTGIKALDQVTLHIKPGEKLAIIGRTASGKTTICDLLTRMFDVTDGNILIDDVPIKLLDLDNLRRRIGYVPQDVFLFSDTISDNITFGIPDSDQSKVEHYSKSAAVYQDIQNLPNKFNTLVGERGVMLSGGQKQRISIARALIKEPDIVILDDSLSAVDTKTEKHILEYLKNDLEDKTTIIVTHRISGVIPFDQIIVLEKGKIVEHGNHESLIEKRGYYYKILEQQRIEEEQIKW